MWHLFLQRQFKAKCPKCIANEVQLRIITPLSRNIFFSRCHTWELQFFVVSNRIITRSLHKSSEKKHWEGGACYKYSSTLYSKIHSQKKGGLGQGYFTVVSVSDKQSPTETSHVALKVSCDLNKWRMHVTFFRGRAILVDYFS